MLPGFPKYYVFIGGTVPPQWQGTVNKLCGGTDRGDKKFVEGGLWLKEIKYL